MNRLNEGGSRPEVSELEATLQERDTLLKERENRVQELNENGIRGLKSWNLVLRGFSTRQREVLRNWKLCLNSGMW